VVPLWFLALGVAWYFNRQRPLQQARIEEWTAAAADKIALAKAVALTQ
jgi:D-serine/D-alanine/glycine transporter